MHFLTCVAVLLVNSLYAATSDPVSSYAGLGGRVNDADNPYGGIEQDEGYSPYEQLLLEDLYNKLVAKDARENPYEDDLNWQQSRQAVDQQRMRDNRDIVEHNLAADVASRETPSLKIDQKALLRDSDGNPQNRVLNPNLRDHEYEQHSPNTFSSDFQYISGGAGEGLQHLDPEGTINNTQEVKSNQPLPFYCHPPNPCPKGYTAEANGCQEGIKDTAEFQKQWIDLLQKRGKCACDDEHMFRCPKNAETINSKPEEKVVSSGNEQLDAMIRSLIEKAQGKNIFMGGSKRLSLIAKKSPEMMRKRSRRSVHMKKKTKYQNPFLAGERLSTVVKKGNVFNFEQHQTM